MVPEGIPCGYGDSLDGKMVDVAWTFKVLNLDVVWDSFLDF